MKKLLLLSAAIGAFVVSASTALAAGEFVALAPIPGLTDMTTTPGIGDFLNNIYKYLLGIAAIAAVIEIIWGGLEYATQDNVSKKQDGKHRIQQAILGLVLVLAPVLVFTIINPAILNMGINMPPINVVGSSYANNANSAIPTAPSAGCATKDGTYLEIATCATSTDASNYTCNNGLTPKIPACRINASTGACLPGPVTVYCGKTITVVYFAYTHKPGGVVNVISLLYADVFGKVTPNSAAAENEFTAGCRTDSGKLTSERTYAGIIFEQNFLRNPLAWSNGCQDAGEIVIDPATAHGAVCYGVDLSCSL